MKTCRFCLNQQEGGEYCEACGSPMEADATDFSGSSFPDPTISTGAAPLPDPTIQVSSNPETSVAPNPETSVAPNPETSDLPDPTAPQASVTQTAPKVVPQAKPTSSNQVIYSAKQAGETVYMKNKGVYRPSGNVAWPIPGVPAQTPIPGTIPSAQGLPVDSSAMGGAVVPNVLPDKSQEVLAGSNKTRAFSLTMLIISSVEIVLCCATNIVSLIVSVLAYNKISRVVNHTSTNEENDKHSADVMNWVAFWITILHFILSVVFLVLLGLDVISI